MTPPAATGRGPLHLAAAIDQPGAYDAAPHIELARLAERGALDFVTLGDSFARQGPDALAVLARIAPATGRVGLVPTVTTTHTEPFHVQAGGAPPAGGVPRAGGGGVGGWAAPAPARRVGGGGGAPRAG
ncbi:LLM class flavin-dependent oxidoreductase, partial [Streptomyces lasiicapitis]|uniref:LLM class flavin-dependent oxidoreductase n=1 Tax=Streptomyces lasiicapitis TaxID=1923961 RepID=UPI0036C1C0C0